MGCIYLITIEADNNKGYVGYSKYSAEERFKGHRHASTAPSKDPITGKFKRARIDQAIANFGIDACKVITLFESSLINEYDINDIFEPFFIKLYDTFGSNGYNGNRGGGTGRGRPKGYKQSESHRKNATLSKIGRKYPMLTGELNTACKNQRKTYEITFEDGHVEIIVGIKKFCRERGYKRPGIYRVMVGEYKYHKDIIKVVCL